MTTVYEFKAASRLKGDPQAVGEVIESIRVRQGAVSPGSVVAAARPKKSALHPYFEWSDAKAGAAYREQQAAHLLRSLIVVSTDELDITEPVRAFVSIRVAAEESDDGDGTYTSITEAIRIPSYRQQLIAGAVRDLEAYRNKYALLADITQWGSALEKACRSLKRAVSSD